MRAWLAFVLFCVSFSAEAMDMSIRGTVLTLSGKFEFGDDVKLKELLASGAGAGVKIVNLHNSPGGWILPMIEMARKIRERRLITVMDAGRGYCHSACTGLFVAGVARHYLNADPALIVKRKGAAGLGFHEGGSNFSGRAQYSGPGTAQMINIYYEMGAGGAAKVVSKASFRGLHIISGAEALALGIATSLSPP